MKKILIISLFILLTLTETFSQIPYVKFNYNFYSMGQLKNFQYEILSDFTTLNLPVKITESYPSYFGYQLGFLFPSDSLLTVGMYLDFSTTGGRIHYEDYSGEIKVDQFVNAISAGANLNFKVKQYAFSKVELSMAARIIFTKFKHGVLFRIGEEVDVDEIIFESLSFGIEPGINYGINIYNFVVNFSLSYLINIPSDLVLDRPFEDLNIYLKNGDKVNANWSGFKFGLSFGYDLDLRVKFDN